MRGINHPELHNPHHSDVQQPTSTLFRDGTTLGSGGNKKVDRKGIAIVLVCVGALTILAVLFVRKMRYPFALRRGNPGVQPVSVVSLNAYIDDRPSEYPDEGYDSPSEEVAFHRKNAKLPDMA